MQTGWIGSAAGVDGALDISVHLRSSDEMNFRITTPGDLQIFRALVEQERCR